MATLATLSATDALSIPAREITFHPHSFADPGGRVFRWRGGLYRAIDAAQAPFIERLFQTGLIERLVQGGWLIETEATPLTLTGYALVLRHRTLAMPAYPNEWCAAMLRDAARCTLELAAELARHELTLKDAHPWNVIFDVKRNLRPVWVDLNSLAPLAGSDWPAADEFRRFCLNPLALMARGHERLARLMMCEEEGVTDALAEQLQSQRLKLTALANRTRNRINARRLAPISQLQKNLEALSLLEPPPLRATTPFPLLYSLLDKLRPTSVLLLGGTEQDVLNTARMVSLTVVFDTDAAFVTHLYQQARQHALPLLPLLMDFTKPTPARGLCDQWTVAATERLACDLVIAPAALINLLPQRRLNEEQFAAGLALLAKVRAIAEFDEQTVGTAARERFAAALSRHFTQVSTLPAGAPGRVLLIGEK